MTTQTKMTILAGAALCLVPFVATSFYTFLFTKILFLALASASFILLAGYGGMLSLAQAAFFGMAGYIVARLSLFHDMPLWQVAPLALLGAIALSAAFAVIAVRTTKIYFLMMTLALSQMAFYAALQWAHITGGYDGITGIDRPAIFGYTFATTVQLYYFTLVPVFLCYLGLKRLVASPFGLALQGTRDSDKRMAALGFNVPLHRFLAIVVSGAVAGLAGILSTYFYGMIGPTTVSIGAAVMILFIALLGGIGRFEGAIVGAVVYVLLEDFASMYTMRYHTLIGLFFIIIVLFFPSGITGIRLKRQKKTPDAGEDGVEPRGVS
jgi:branched-chain amino acid transport system permease protein